MSEEEQQNSTDGGDGEKREKCKREGTVRLEVGDEKVVNEDVKRLENEDNER